MPKPSYFFEAIGTHFEIVTRVTLTEHVKEEIQQLIQQFDGYFSRFRVDSVAHKMAKEPGVYLLPKGSQRLFKLYESLYRLTRGKMTPLIGASLEAAGYDAAYSFTRKDPVTAPEYDVIAHRDGLAFTLEAPALLDIGAAGKGYLIDHIAALLETNAIREYIIDGSGDIITKGDISEVVGLEDPLNTDSVIGEIDLQNEALCASAVNRRAWGEGMHHIIDPETGEPSRQVIATWVITDSAMVADGLATALFFTDPHRLETEYTYEYMRIKADHSIEYSRRFEAALYKG